MELGDKSSSIFIDKPTYQARKSHSFHISQSLPQNSFGKDCVAGLEIFLRTAKTVPVLNHDCYIQMIECRKLTLETNTPVPSECRPD